MSTVAWRTRKTRLIELLGAEDDENSRGLALDRILHGQSVIGKTAKTSEIDKVRFGDRDLHVLGTLEYGQYGVVSNSHPKIDIVSCKLDNKVYVRKSIEKKFAIRTQDQCSPLFERDLLRRATISRSHWAPHLLCAFQTETHLNLVMDYAEGGTLWDILESSPLDGRISEDELCWWAPQIIGAIDWCHTQGFVHSRDVKPHNFVLNAQGHALLIDFGSAAPLLPAHSDGSQTVPKKYCLVPCGTCDYISPEILQCHEEALVALEMADSISNPPSIGEYEPGGYGRETDWWSVGAMLYEMIYGVAPFFANDIRHTYLKIVDHYRSLKFKSAISVSPGLQDLIRRLLTTAELRLGRQSIEEIMGHSFFHGTDWANLHAATRPDTLHLPQFTYSAPLNPPPDPSQLQEDSVAFEFSALFQSSTSSPPFSVLQPTPSQKSNKSILRERPSSSFIGFSWGPSIDAFRDDPQEPSVHKSLFIPQIPTNVSTPQSTKFLSTQAPPQRYPFQTPIKQNAITPFQTLPRTGTVRRTAQKRPLSDREAMKQLVNCVGMSARKKVLESGRKPRILTSAGHSRSSTLKGLRFDRSVMVLNGDSGRISYRMDPTVTTTTSESAGAGSFSLMSASLISGTGSGHPNLDDDVFLVDSESSLDSDVMYSPSPSPRPSSAMSMATISRSGGTQAMNGSLGLHMQKKGHASVPSVDRGRSSPSFPPNSQSSDAQEVSMLTDRIANPPLEERNKPRKPATNTRQGGSASQPVSINTTVAPKSLDNLEQRHARLLKDIAGISERLSEVVLRISRS
ncbi:kinase-like domain-containing protein [Irpex rosettiformis]|uniref:Kinase-like domain-containing protein n=1 Tax=Irpex rosettiformis TaxID=378272 RepID=A0ACB8TPE7_9APHY|nr:kinase-like domain-containing protein [Irpex rosettiformis]